MKLSNFKTLPAPETNTFTPGDTVICYDSEVSSAPDVVEDVDRNRVLLQNHDMYVDFRTCRRLVRREPKEFFLVKNEKPKRVQNIYGESIFKDTYEVHETVPVRGNYIKVLEVLEE